MTDVGPAPHVAFVLEPILGHATHAGNLRRLVPMNPAIRAEFYSPPFAVQGLASHVPLYRSNWSIRAGVRARGAIRRLDRRQHLDGLFVHTQVPAVLAPDWLRRIPTIVSIDATPRQYDELGLLYEHAVGGRLVEGLKRRANERCFTSSRHVVAWSAWARSGLAEYGVPAEKVTVIAPGVDLERWRRPPDATRHDDGAIRLLFVGGDMDRKGGNVLLEAFRRLRGEPAGANLALHIVTTANVASTAGVVVHRDLTPNDPALIRLYHESDVFCLPTAGDCLPMVLAEAGAAGLPLVSTPVGAIPEIVLPGRTGELVAPGDSDALVATLRQLVTDPERRRRLGAGAAAIVARDHDAEKNAGRIVDVIVDAITRRRS